MSRHRFIRAEQAAYPVTLLCQVLSVARSGCDAWARRGVSTRAQADEDVTVQRAAANARSRRTYGAPRTCAALRAREGRVLQRLAAALPAGFSPEGSPRCRTDDQRRAGYRVSRPEELPLGGCSCSCSAAMARRRRGRRSRSTWKPAAAARSPPPKSAPAWPGPAAESACRRTPTGSAPPRRARRRRVARSGCVG